MRIDPGNTLPPEVQAAIIRISNRDETAQVKYDKRSGTFKVYSLRPKLEYEASVCKSKNREKAQSLELSSLAKAVLKNERITPKEYESKG